MIQYMVPEISIVTERFFYHLEQFFAILPPPNSPKNENIKKMKTTPGDIIILHKCTKTDDHRLHCS